MGSPPSLPPVRRLMAGSCVLAALAVAGCGSAGADGSTAHTTRSSRRATATAPAHTSAPVTATTAATTTSISATTTPSASGATLPGTGKPVVTIGDKNYTEQFVLGQLYLKALKAQGFTVNITANIGPPAVVTQALKSGSLAMYPEYLNTFDQTIAQDPHPLHSRGQALRAGRQWAHAHGLRLLAPTPFSDTAAIAVTDAYAAAHHLRSLADLRRVGATLVIGGAAQFADAAPGLPTLSAVYGVAPAAFQSLAVGDQYSELDNGTVAAAYVNTTDGELATGDYQVLADPRRIFGFGNVVPVLSSAAAAKEGPAFAATIDRVDRTLTLPTMRALNNAVDVAGESPADVAAQYLETHGLLGPLRGRQP